MDTSRIAWHSDLAIGDPEIDAQHRAIVEMVASLPDDASSPDGALLEAVLNYAASHFGFEEALMERVEYPERIAHRRIHRKLTMILMAQRREYEDGKTDLYTLKQFMFAWVRDHIMEEDQKIGRHLAARQEGTAGGGGD